MLDCKPKKYYLNSTGVKDRGYGEGYSMTRNHPILLHNCCSLFSFLLPVVIPPPDGGERVFEVTP